MTWILPKQLHTLASALDMEALSWDSSEQSQIFAQSLFVRSKPSQSRIWSAKWKRDSWTRRLSGRILKPSLGERFATAWTSSLGDIPASPSAQPGSAKESKTRGTSGRGLQMVFDFSDPGAASLRTSKDISAWGCPTSSKTWQEWVTERRGAYSARLNAERLTNASGCSSWPTVQSCEAKSDTLQDRKARGKQIMLCHAVRLWPTTSARDWKDSPGMTTQAVNPDGSPRDRTDQLARAVYATGPAAPASSSTDGSRPGLWATPRAGKTTDENPETWAKRQAKGDVATMPLTAQVKTWQTATVSTGAHRQKDGSMTDKLDQQVKVTTTGKLNARWVCTLMNVPVFWVKP